MKYIEVIASEGSAATVLAIAEKVKATDVRFGMVGDDGMQTMRLLVSNDNLQLTLDRLQTVLGAQNSARIIVLNVEASLPKTVEEKAPKKDSATAARELIYTEVERGAKLDWNFNALVVLSTIVAAIGLLENNIAVVVGAMVIAPLLGPNLALSLGTALGDVDLMRKSFKTLIVGLLLAIFLSAVLGFFWTASLDSNELLSRTEVNIESIILALASGAAAALSLTTGLSGVLVGVMVAVALLPPAVTLGIMLGSGNVVFATGAGLLLAVNIVSVNLASKIVFYLKGVHPRTWLEKETAKKAMFRYVLGWVVTLFLLVLLMYMRRYG